MTDSVIEVNVSIMCACMPACAHYFRRHGGAFRSLSSRLHLRIKSLYNMSSPKANSDENMHPFQRANSYEAENDKMKLTLGSTARTARFLETRDWPMERA